MVICDGHALAFYHFASPSGLLTAIPAECAKLFTFKQLFISLKKPLHVVISAVTKSVQ